MMNTESYLWFYSVNTYVVKIGELVTEGDELINLIRFFKFDSNKILDMACGEDRICNEIYSCPKYDYIAN